LLRCRDSLGGSSPADAESTTRAEGESRNEKQALKAVDRCHVQHNPPSIAGFYSSVAHLFACQKTSTLKSTYARETGQLETPTAAIPRPASRSAATRPRTR
jgi:hypothetical protein